MTSISTRSSTRNRRRVSCGRCCARTRRDGRIFWCCGHPALMSFICGVLAITFIGGVGLWELGILQPILAQTLMYVYIMIIVVAFVNLLVSQLWNLVRRMVNFIMMESQKMKDTFRLFRKKDKFPGQRAGASEFFNDDLTSRATRSMPTADAHFSRK